MTSSPKKRKAKTNDSDESVARLDALGPYTQFISRQGEEQSTRRIQPGRFINPPEENLGSRIHETRESRLMTQGDLANLTKSLDAEDKGISRAVISLYESGTNRPSPREIRLLCEALQVTPNYLIYGNDDPFGELTGENRFGSLERNDPEGYAWVAYIMMTIHHNHYDAVMKIVLDLARGWNKGFDQGLQEKANTVLLDMATELAERLRKRRLDSENS